MKNLKISKEIANKSLFRGSRRLFHIEDKKGSTKLWGGRFDKDVSQSILKWTESISVDSHIVVEDLWGSISHVSMLGHQNIVPWEKANKIIPTLLRYQNEWIDGKWKLTPENEDVHLNVEGKLIKDLGMDIGGRMHTCRSRNDQVCLDSRLYTRNKLLTLRNLIVTLIEEFLKKAETGYEDVMPSYTHVQHAQPISVAFWLSHYAAAYLRDLKRLKNAFDTADLNPLGSGAIAGSSFNLDRMMTTKLMGFQKVQEHSLDACSARDFLLESTSSVAAYYSTCSRLAEEFILWSSYEFQTITLDDGFAMGSSMMPQKKNPGMLELIRGRSGRVNGLANAALTMIKGLPSGYNRDFHEDKEITVEIFDLAIRMTEALPSLIQSTRLNLDRMATLAGKNFSTATELANYLVLIHNVPFREAHHIVGSLVGELYRKGENFENFQYCYDHLKKNNINAPEADVKRVLDAKSVMMSYNALGGTGPIATKNTIKNLWSDLEEHKKVLAGDQHRVTNAYNTARTIASQVGDAKSYEDYCSIIQKNITKH
jgi:argininosuccinate lyase